MKRVRITDAQSQLPQLVDSLAGNGDILLTRNDKPIARLAPLDAQTTLRAIEPVSVGAVLVPLSVDDDLLGEMLGQ